MLFSFNAFALILIILGCITVGLAIFIYKKVGSSTFWFSLMVFSNAIWAIGYGFEIASTTLDQVLLMIKFEFIGIVSIPIFWFLFALRFSGKECWYKKPLNAIAILIVPLASLIAVWTNSLHHLYFVKTALVFKNGIAMFDMLPGLAYYVLTIYFYLLLACGCYLLFKKYQSGSVLFKRQNSSIIFAALVPWVANIAYLFGFRPLGFLDITPFAFIISNLLILLSIYRFKLFDVIPIAREKVLDLIQDGFLVIDHKHRIIDANKSIIRHLKNKEVKQLIGAQLENIFPRQPLLVQRIEDKIPGIVDLTLTTDTSVTSLEADICFLDEDQLSDQFTIIKFHDCTNAKAEAKLFKQQTLELEKLNNLKDRIFSIIAHDLRGPLINLSEVLKLVSSKQIELTEFEELSPALSKDINYTTDLLENILHWSRSQLKGFGIKKENFDVRNTIINEINYHSNAAQLKNVRIIHDVFPNHVVHADIIMFQIIIRNLLNNAIKFCENGGLIEIGARHLRNGFVEIMIKDDGVGMSPDVVEKLFKNQNFTTRGTFNERGTGIGLLVCKDFVERNGGSINVESAEKKGSTFVLMLPFEI